MITGKQQDGADPTAVGVVLFDDEVLPRAHEGLEGEVLPRALDDLGGEADIRILRGHDELARHGGEAEVLFVWQYRDQLLGPAWDQLASLRWVHTASAGVDAVVCPEMLEGDVVVTNSRGILDDTIAEWVLAVLLFFAKDLRTTLALQARREWRHRESERLAGQRILVVGAGSVGRAIARLCRSVGLHVEGIARRPRDHDPDFDTMGTPADLIDRLGETDAVVVAAPLTAETRGLIGATELAALPAGARLVNVGRGPVVDEAALLEALRRGHLAGAALDVFDAEPLPPDHPFWAMDQVLVSPHQSGDFAGWRDAFCEFFVDNLRRYRLGEPLQNVVDVAAALAGSDRARP